MAEHVKSADKLKPLNVLVVDDSITNRKLMSTMLQKMGHVVKLAEDGSQALALCEQNMPDMVLMDVQMPVMDGLEAARELRKRYNTWFPIVFLSAQTANDEVLDGLRAGGDDYLFKPVNYEILQAKISQFHVRLNQGRSLLMYKERIEYETETARHFIERFTGLDKLNDPWVQFMLKPLEQFSGDMIAFARTPNDCLHVLLADSTGHGLTASLAVIPIIQPFYQMTQKGFDLASILAEINSKVREYLPLPRFVAAAMVSIDPEAGIVRTWNGGMPPVLLLSENGKQILHSFKSKQLPLGVVEGDEFDNATEYFNLTDQPLSVLMCSDGVTEIRESNRMLNHDGLLLLAQQSLSGLLFDKVVKVIEDQLAIQPSQDDIALLVVNYPGKGAREAAVTSFRIGAPLDKIPNIIPDNTDVVLWEMSFLLKAPQLKCLDVVPFLMGIIRQIKCKQGNSKLFLVLSELFNNALDHGLLKLDSRLKNDTQGMEQYFMERTVRLAGLEAGQISFAFEEVDSGLHKYLKISVADSGEGFDFSSVLSCDLADNDKRHGRGIGLLMGMCHSVSYVGSGSEAIVLMEI